VVILACHYKQLEFDCGNWMLVMDMADLVSDWFSIVK
jgi:hypothetical protein